MKVKFLPKALKELEDAINFYNDQLNELGNQFSSEVFNCINIIRIYPDRNPKFYLDRK